MHTTIIQKDIQTVFNEIEKQISAHAMLLLCHINGQANAARIGENVPGVCVLEVFRPEYAVRVWRAEQQAGIEIPIRIYMYEGPNGETVINHRSLSEAMMKYNSQELLNVGGEADEVITSIIALTANNLYS